jgi:hypothetical protein
MKKLLNTLYVTTQGSYLAKEGETVLVRVEHENRLRVPLHTLSGIVCFGQVSCSPPLMGFCVEFALRKMSHSAFSPSMASFSHGCRGRSMATYCCGGNSIVARTIRPVPS